MNYFTNAFNSGNGDEFHLENVKGMSCLDTSCPLTYWEG